MRIATPHYGPEGILRVTEPSIGSDPRDDERQYRSRVCRGTTVSCIRRWFERHKQHCGCGYCRIQTAATRDHGYAVELVCSAGQSSSRFLDVVELKGLHKLRGFKHLSIELKELRAREKNIERDPCHDQEQTRSSHPTMDHPAASSVPEHPPPWEGQNGEVVDGVVGVVCIAHDTEITSVPMIPDTINCMSPRNENRLSHQGPWTVSAMELHNASAALRTAAASPHITP